MNKLREWFYALREEFGFGVSPYIRKPHQDPEQEEAPTVSMTDVGVNSDGVDVFFTYYSDGSSTERPVPKWLLE